MEMSNVSVYMTYLLAVYTNKKYLYGRKDCIIQIKA